MQKLHVPIRVVLYREEQRWFAHCLEFDLMGDGVTQGDALSELAEAIGLQVQASVEHDDLANLFHPADGLVFARFAAGRDVAGSDLRLQIGPVTVSHAMTREYDAQTLLAAAS